MNKLKISGFKNQKRIVNSEFKKIMNGNAACRGYCLDEINLNVTITNKMDIAELMNILQTITPCFDDGKEN